MLKNINSFWKKFEDNKISHSATHYLFTIHELLETHGYARMVDIGRHLKITAWSCSTGIKSLVKKELIIEDSNKFIRLTPTWIKIIESILENRRVLSDFFKNFLWISEEKALENACKIEHLIGKEVIEKLKHVKQKN